MPSPFEVMLHAVSLACGGASAHVAEVPRSRGPASWAKR
jgi:hypothetical protein